MTTYNQDVQCHAGEDVALSVSVADDISGCVVAYELHDITGGDVDLGETPPTVELAVATVEGGFEITGMLPRTITATLGSGMYRHHFIATDGNGEVSFLAEGTLTIIDD